MTPKTIATASQSHGDATSRRIGSLCAETPRARSSGAVVATAARGVGVVAPCPCVDRFVASVVSAELGDACCGTGAPNGCALAGAPGPNDAVELASLRSKLDAAGAGAAAGAPPALVADGALEMSVVAAKARTASPLAIADRVRSGAIQNGTVSRGTSDREGAGAGRRRIRAAVARSSATRPGQTEQPARCVAISARRGSSSAPSRYAERSANGCTAVLASTLYDAPRGHRFHHPAEPFHPLATRTLRTATRARCMRDFTVPISHAVMDAISSYAKPSTSRSSSAAR